jgi:lambda family phage portal protein
LNEDHWADAKDESLNTLLASDLPTLRARSQYEFLNNPLVKGVVKTYGDDIAGPNGPTLTVQSDDDNYNKILEQIWREWWVRPDLNGVFSGVDILNLSMYQVWTVGDYLWQIVTDREAKGPIQSRVLLIHPRRMTTPYDKTGDDSVVLGVRRSKTGKPLSYYIEEAPQGEGLQRYSLEYAEVPAADMVHGFEHLDSEQVRGFPWLTSCLPVVAELRDYDQQVLEAAKMAAALAVLLFARNPDVGFAVVNETTEIESGTMKTLPPGYEAMQVTPHQPPAVYRDFRAERMRELGRPVGMPLLTVNLDARGHSWSSARLDRDVYHSGLRVQQGGINRTGLNRLLDVVRREAELALLIPMRSDVKYVWTWPVFSSIDPLKEAKGATERLQSGTSTLAQECAALGEDWEEVIEQRKREQEGLRKAGLLRTPKQEKEPVKKESVSNN